MDKFVNLHGHSYFSLLDGMTRPSELVDYTLKLEQPASCITDHGVMYSVVDHFQYAEKKGQRAIAGFEAYVVNDHKIKDKSEKSSETELGRQHMVLLAKNNDGYKRLMKICSVGMTDGFYYRPRIDDKVIEDYGTDGIIGLSACLAGRIAQYILRDNIEEAEKWAIYYFKLFKENFYLEMQPITNDEGKQVKVNQGLIEIHKRTGIPMVITTDYHYLKKEDAATHDVLLAVQSRSQLSDPNRWKFPGDSFYVMSREEILGAFKKNGHEVLDQKIIEEAADNTVTIAEQCSVSFNWGKHYLPKINPPADDAKFNNWAAHRQSDGSVSADYLRYLCIIGLKNKGKTSKEYRDRLDYELGVINNMGFPDYFLIMEDIMRYCRTDGIPVGPARGCFLSNVPVVTQDSVKNIKDVKVGDIVKGHDEQYHTVTNLHEYDCDEEIVSLKLGDKNIEGVTKDHKVYAIKKADWDKGIREPQWYATDELEIDDYVAEL